MLRIKASLSLAKRPSNTGYHLAFECHVKVFKSIFSPTSNHSAVDAGFYRLRLGTTQMGTQHLGAHVNCHSGCCNRGVKESSLLTFSLQKHVFVGSNIGSGYYKADSNNSQTKRKKIDPFYQLQDSWQLILCAAIWM